MREFPKMGVSGSQKVEQERSSRVCNEARISLTPHALLPFSSIYCLVILMHDTISILTYR